MYYFGFDTKTKNLIINNTSSGALVVNDTIIHFASHYLPFGGVGTSGYSAYHGKYGFDNLSHIKPVLDKSSILAPFRYPPSSGTKMSIMNNLLKVGGLTQGNLLNGAIYLGLAVTTYLLRNNLYSGFNGFLNPKF